MRNVEIKAKVRDCEQLCKAAADLSGGTPTVIRQDDTFYRVNEGRLKMRFYADGSATLVRYSRADEGGPKLCDYELLQFGPAEGARARQLADMLARSLGERGRVLKERKLYMVGQTRVHVDHVQGLGHFMELEVVLRPEQDAGEGRAVARDLQRRLGVPDEDLVEGAYVDLLDHV